MMKYILPLICVLSILTSCGGKQKIDVVKFESLTIDTKRQPISMVLDLQLTNNMTRDIEFLEASASLLPERELKLRLLEPLKIKAGQERVSVRFTVDGLNIFQLPALMQSKVVHIELETLVKIGRRKPMKFKSHLPINVNDIMKNALKNQDYDQ